MVTVILLIMILLSPLQVNANIICKDGTESKSCSVCSPGCCSYHGGCSDTSYESIGYDNEVMNVSKDENTEKNEFLEKDSNEIIKDYQFKKIYFIFSALFSGITFIMLLTHMD